MCEKENEYVRWEKKQFSLEKCEVSKLSAVVPPNLETFRLPLTASVLRVNGPSFPLCADPKIDFFDDLFRSLFGSMVKITESSVTAEEIKLMV